MAFCSCEPKRNAMKNKGTLAGLCAAAAMLALAAPAQAGSREAGSSYRHHDRIQLADASYDRKRAAKVRGFVRRGGYYSYTDSDVTNVYGGSRALFGSTNSYRDPFIDRQTTAGPFDHGFFFDSGIGPRGGDAPYPR
jgi:hypothetical protein